MAQVGIIRITEVGPEQVSVEVSLDPKPSVDAPVSAVEAVLAGFMKELGGEFNA